MVDSRLRGSDIAARPINYPKAKCSDKLLAADREGICPACSRQAFPCSKILIQ